VLAPTGTKQTPLAWRTLDTWNREVGRGAVSVTLDPQGYGQAEIELPASLQGSFKCEAFAAAQAPTDVSAMPQAEVIYHVLPHLKSPAEVPDSFFGGHVSLTPYNLLIAEKAGFCWLRLHPPLTTKWMVVEPRKDEFVFNTAGVARARQQGFHILGNFDTTPAFRADAAPADAAKSTWYTSFAPASLDDWSNYVRRTAKAFAPYIDHWEVWNEPDGGFLRVRDGQDKEQVYLKLVEAARKAVNEAEPGAKLIGPTVATLERPFATHVLAKGLGKSLDGLSFHLYSEDLGPEEKRPPLLDQIQALRNAEIEGGTENLPLWHTEGGIWLQHGNTWLKTTGKPPIVTTSVADAASTLVRTAVALKAMGVTHHFMYAAYASPAGRVVYRDECSGMIDVNGIPHAALGAHAAMVAMIEEATPVKFEQIAAGSAKVSVARFRKGDTPITVLWSRQPATLAAIPDLDAHATAYDMMGNPIPLDATTTVGLSPIYLLSNR
jgi:hypothetical protein